MRILLWLVVFVCSANAHGQQFDRIDWRQSAVFEAEGKVVLVNSTPTHYQNARIAEVAHVAFTGEGVMAIVAFDCAIPDSSFDLQWGELNDGVVDHAVVAPKPSSAFGLTAYSRSQWVAPQTWSQVCADGVSEVFPENLLWDEALLYVRTQNKQWQKRFHLDKSSFWPLEKQYGLLPMDQRDIKLQRLSEKKAERTEMVK